MSAASDFNQFLTNLVVSSDSRDSISYRYRRITRQLNQDYYEDYSETNHSRYVGSYGRGTAIGSFSDLDMLFKLPYSVYKRFKEYLGNGQSALLAEFRDSLKKTYPSTHVSGDGQVVVINFTDSISFEILPAFVNNDGSYTYPDSNNGGSWKVTNPIPEIEAVSKTDSDTNGNMKDLCKMARAWKKEWSVPIGGLLIDTLCFNFLKSWAYVGKSRVYYDYMTRDFMYYLMNQNQDQDYWYALGSMQKVNRKGLFEYKAKQCYNIACDAVAKYASEFNYSACLKMREIYGTSYPL